MKNITVCFFLLWSLQVFGQVIKHPAIGSTFELQFNQNGTLSGDTQLVFDTALKELSVNNLSLTNGLWSENTSVLTIPTIQGTQSTSYLKPFSNFYHTLSQSYINSDGQRDAVYQWGYNQDGVGGRRNREEASLHFAIESHYQPYGGASPNFEWHIESQTHNGYIQRNMSMNINKADGHSSMFFTTDQLYFWPSAVIQQNTLPYAVISTGGASFGASNVPDQLFTFSAGNNSPATTAQLKIQPIPGGIIEITNASGGDVSNHMLNFKGATRFEASQYAAGQGAPFSFHANVGESGQYLFRVMQKENAVFNISDNKKFQFVPLSTGGEGNIRVATIDQYGQLGASAVGKGLSIDENGKITADINPGAAIEQVSITRENFILKSINTAQNAFAEPILLESNTSYLFEGQYIIHTGKTSRVISKSFSLETDASVSSVDYVINVTTSRGSGEATATSVEATTLSEQYVSGIEPALLNQPKSAEYTIIKFKGVWQQQTSSLMIPQITISSHPTRTNSIKPGSFIKFSKVNESNPTYF